MQNLLFTDFKNEYDIITLERSYRFTTVSPPYTDDDPNKIVDIMIQSLKKYIKLFKYLTLTIEMTTNMRIHFHLMYTFDMTQQNATLHYFFINKTLRKGLYWNVLVLDCEPKQGVKYLIKDDLVQHFIKFPRITTLTYIKVHLLRLKELQQQLYNKEKLKRHDELTQSVPRIWRHDDSSEYSHDS